MTLSAGTTLGPYEIGPLLGSGGMGKVYRARDTRLDRAVAIKILREAHPDLRARFAREAKAIAALAHPHICTLFDVGHEPDTDYLVMECLEGETLADLLKGGALPLEQALRTAIEIGDALDVAHRKGIIHCDLKPANVMITKSGAKLLDFGIARMMTSMSTTDGRTGALSTDTQTVAGTLVGTVPYMAPELLEGRDVDSRTDVFAFGALLYEMLTGRRAFTGDHQSQVIAAILESQPQPVSAARPQTPMLLDHLVQICLAKDPDERWQSAGDIKRQLQWIAAKPAESAGVTTAPRRRRSAQVRWLMGAAVVALAAIAALTFVDRRSSSEMPLLRFQVNTPPTSDSFSFALSPDGRQLVFVAAGEKGLQLWLQPLDQTFARPLAGTEDASYPFWAPDSRAIGFFANAKLKRVDLAGGAPQELAAAHVGGGGSWSRNGVILFAGTDPRMLMKVDASGGLASPATRLEDAAQHTIHSFPEFLPDGVHFLFHVKANDQPEMQGVYVGSLDSPRGRRLVAADNAATYSSGYLLMMRQGDLIATPFDAAAAALSGDPVRIASAVETGVNPPRGAFSVSASGLLAYRTGESLPNQLVWLDRQGRAIKTLGPPQEGQLFPELSLDGEKVSVQRDGDVWLMETVRGVPSRFTFDRSNSPAVWSPEAQRVVFSSNRRGGFFDLVEKADNGPQETPVFTSPESKVAVDWSRDGRFLLYQSVDTRTGGSHLWALPLTGERKPFPIGHVRFNEDEGQFSPDGRWIAYRSTESGRHEIHLQRFPGPGAQLAVSMNGGSQPRWRSDGQELFYVASDNQLMAVPINLPATGETLTLGTPTALFSTHLAGMTFPKQGYAVAADGQRFLMNVRMDQENGSPITVVQNWTAALERSTDDK